MQEFKKCHFCQKDTKKEMLYKTLQSSNYKYLYLCYRCNAYRNRGCIFDKYNKRWIGKRRPAPRKSGFTATVFINRERKSEHFRRVKANISYANILDYLD